MRTENLELHEEDGERPTFKNIILVGTKADLCGKSRRMVTPEMAAALCNRLGLAGAIECSSKVNSRFNKQDTFFTDLNDCFKLAACLCVDQTTRERAFEYSMMP